MTDACLDNVRQCFSFLWHLAQLSYIKSTLFYQRYDSQTAWTAEPNSMDENAGKHGRGVCCRRLTFVIPYRRERHARRQGFRASHLPVASRFVAGGGRPYSRVRHPYIMLLVRMLGAAIVKGGKE